MPEHSQCIIAISGVKNSGKTTLIEKILGILKEKGIKAAVIKHDGHEFSADVPGTDTYRHLSAGAAGTICYSATKYMLVKNQADPDPNELIKAFPDADMIIMEGLKNSPYPKIEIVRRGNSDTPICPPESLIGIATDIAEEDRKFPKAYEGSRIYDLNNAEEIAQALLDLAEKIKENSPAPTPFRVKTKLVLSGNNDFFGPGVARLLHLIDKYGSIQKAAAEMEMSYSKAWKMLRKAEEETGLKFLDRINGGKQGGGSTLTDQGRHFLQKYDQMCRDLREISDHHLEKYFGI